MTDVSESDFPFEVREGAVPERFGVRVNVGEETLIATNEARVLAKLITLHANWASARAILESREMYEEDNDDLHEHFDDIQRRLDKWDNTSHDERVQMAWNMVSEESGLDDAVDGDLSDFDLDADDEDGDAA